jgi:hypothetical protein
VSDELDIPSPVYRIPRHRGGVDPGTRKLAIIAGSLGAALIVLVGGWSVLGHRSTGVPLIEADTSPLRVKPENPGGMSVSGSSDEILSGDADGTVGKLAPGSETPAPQDIKPPAMASAPPLTAAPPPVATAPVAPMTAAPAAKPPATAPAHVATADHAAAHATGGKTMVQLAALPTEDAAKLEWDRLAKRMPDLLGSRKPAISKFDHDGKVWWRVRTGGFSDVAQATTFCEQLRAKGTGCSIAAF